MSSSTGLIQRCAACRKQGIYYRKKGSECNHKEALWAVKFRVGNKQILKKIVEISEKIQGLDDGAYKDFVKALHDQGVTALDEEHDKNAVFNEIQAYVLHDHTFDENVEKLEAELRPFCEKDARSRESFYKSGVGKKIKYAIVKVMDL